MHPTDCLEVQAIRMERRRQKKGKRREFQEQRQARADAAVAAQAPKKVTPFEPLTDAQADYADAIDYHVITFGLGPAGTGKTYVAGCKAADHLSASSRNTVIVTRPAVEAAGERLGFLPGELDEKFGPYVKPLMRVLIGRLGRGFVDCAIKNERLRVMPMAFMRGESFDDTLILADEMQNATREQVKMLLTRIGEGTRAVLDGDPRQTDIGPASGLEDAAFRLRGAKGVAVVRFTRDDIVRSNIVRTVLDAYENHPIDKGASA